MKRKFLIIILLMINVIGYGQQNVKVPSSPEGRILMRQINLDVNKSTGITGVNIPLHTVKSSDLEVSIGLSYNCSGIKVLDIASWVGLGWNLTAGGKITRVIMDEDDDNGYLGAEGQNVNNPNTWQNMSEFDKIYGACDLEKDKCTKCNPYDSEPDIFYFQIPGYSGMFVIASSGEAYTIPYSNLKIEHLGLSQFTLTDENGTKYYFNDQETTIEKTYSKLHPNGVTRSYTSSWNLTKMESYKGEKITFEYRDGANISYTNPNEIKYIENNETKIYNTSSEITIVSKYISKIVTSTETIEFNPLSRADVTNGRKLDNITITYLNNPVPKKINFTYSYFSSNRLTLDEITENVNAKSMLINRFSYNTNINLPSRDSKDFDHWGYYNGANNSSNFNANRNVSFEHTKANILTRIYYNTGGYVQYEYESNDLGTMVMPSLRIKAIKIYNENNILKKSTSYEYSGGVGFSYDTVYENIIYKDKVYYTYNTLNINDIGGSNVYYAKVNEIFDNGSKIEYNYTTYSDHPDILSVQHLVPGYETHNNENNLYLNSSQFWKRGLLTSQKMYSLLSPNNYKEVKSITYNYKLDGAVKKEICGYVPAKYKLSTYGDMTYYFKYKWISQPIYLESTTTMGIDIPTTTETNTYDTDYMKITEQSVSSNGDVYKTKFKYPFNYIQRLSNGGVGEVNAVDSLLKLGIYSQPIEIIKYKNNKIISGELNTFKCVQNENYTFIPMISKSKILPNNNPLETSSFIESSVNNNGLFTHDTRYLTAINYDSYDNKLNLISSHLEHEQPTSVIYGYNFLLPIANIKNAVYYQKSNSIRENQVFHTSFEEDANALNLALSKTGSKAYKYSYNLNLSNFKPGIYQLSYWKSVNNGTTWTQVTENLTVSSTTSSYVIGSTSYFIDEVRLLPKNATMSTCTSIPGIGKTSETDINGNTTYYEYDEFGRLLKILDNERKKITEYEYFIKK